MKKILLLSMCSCITPLFCMEKKPFKTNVYNLTIKTSKETSNEDPDYLKKNLQYSFADNSLSENSKILITNYFSTNKDLLSKSIFYKDGCEEKFTPLHLAVISENSYFINWLEKEQPQNIHTKSFLQYLIRRLHTTKNNEQKKRLNDSIEKYFLQNKKLLSKKIYKKDRHDSLFTPIQLAFIFDNTTLFNSLSEMTKNSNYFFDSDFLQYVIKNKNFNEQILTYFKENKELINKKIYKKNNDQKSVINIRYTPLRLALVLKNTNLALGLIDIGADPSTIHDKKLLLKQAIKKRICFKTHSFLQKLLHTKNILTMTMHFVDVPLKPLEYALLIDNHDASKIIHQEIIKMIQLDVIKILEKIRLEVKDVLYTKSTFL